MNTLSMSFRLLALAKTDDVFLPAVSLQVKPPGIAPRQQAMPLPPSLPGVVRTALPNREIECRLHFLGMRCVLRFVLGFGMAIDAG